MVTDNYEIDWELVSQDVQPDGAGVGGNRLWARETENKLYRLTRTNYSYSGRLDWSPTDGHRVFFESIFSTFTDDEARDNYIFDTDDRHNGRGDQHGLCRRLRGQHLAGRDGLRDRHQPARHASRVRTVDLHKHPGR
jgi:hypothetical protein